MLYKLTFSLGVYVNMFLMIEPHMHSGSTQFMLVINFLVSTHEYSFVVRMVIAQSSASETMCANV